MRFVIALVLVRGERTPTKVVDEDLADQLWFFLNDHKHRYDHAAWHCCVIMGSVFHYLFLYRSLVTDSVA